MRIVAFFAFAFAVLASLACLPALAGDEGAVRTVEDMADDVVSLFPRAEGLVTEAGDRTAVVDIGSRAGLKTGMELLLFRQGKPIIHPVTKVVLGSTEVPLGRMMLTEVGEDTSTGDITELAATRIIPGDAARLSTEPSPLTVRTVGADVDSVLLDRLLTRLRVSDRFVILGPSGPEAEGQADDSPQAEPSYSGQAYELDFSTASSPEKNRLVAGLTLRGPDGGELFALSDTVDATSEVYDESVMEFPLVRGDYRDFYITEELPFRGKHMAVGNVSGDDEKEVVVSEGHGLYVFRFDGRILRELWREEDPPVTNNHLSIECADLNGNGLDEIYVTNFEGEALSSYVVEYTGEGFRRICGPVGLFFRVLEVPGRKSMLITTTKGSASPFSGIIYEYAWKEGELVRGGKVELPDRIKDPYGFVLADLVPEKKPVEDNEQDGKGPFDGLEFLWVDDADYLQLLDTDGKRMWRSGEHYGGYDNYFELDKKSLALPTVDPRGKVKGRLVVREDANGQKSVVVTRNVPLTYVTEKFKGYTTSDIFSLFWDGAEMEVGWSIKNIDGYIADIYVGDAVHPGSDEIMVLLEPTMKILKKSKSLPLGSVGSVGNVTADRSSLMVYKIPLR